MTSPQDGQPTMVCNINLMSMHCHLERRRSLVNKLGPDLHHRPVGVSSLIPLRYAYLRGGLLK